MMHPNDTAAITVILPTYNRSSILPICLQRLEAQSINNFNVLIVNDGSSDDTEAVLSAYQARTRLRLRVLTQPNSGPARARNHAISQAQTELSILIGDDILVAPDFIEQHLELHRDRPAQAVVGLGYTCWDTELQQLTPFMRWLEDVQFDYANLLAGVQPTWQHFYTSNLSFKTTLLLQTPFNERFQKAAFEDIEVGYRLARQNRLELVLLPQARATHVHPFTYADSARRMRSVGYSEHQFHDYWPAARITPPSSGLLFKLKDKLRTQLATHPRLLDALTSSVQAIAHDRRPNKLAIFLLNTHYRRGYLEYPVR